MASSSSARRPQHSGGRHRSSGPSGSADSSGSIGTAPIRKALLQGDYRLARSLAQGVLQNGPSSEFARAEAQQVYAATAVSKEAILTGVVAGAVVLALFVFVALQAG